MGLLSLEEPPLASTASADDEEVEAVEAVVEGGESEVEQEVAEASSGDMEGDTEGTDAAASAEADEAAGKARRQRANARAQAAFCYGRMIAACHKARCARRGRRRSQHSGVPRAVPASQPSLPPEH